MNIALYVNSLILNAAALTADGATASAGFDPLKKIIIALVIGLIVGLLYALSLKSQLTSVYKNETAADIFMYSKTEKTEKPKQQGQ